MIRVALAVLLLGLTGAVVGLASCGDKPHAIAVSFPEAAGLKPGDDVTVRGLSVGQVTDLDIEGAGIRVSLEIKPRYRKHLDDKARFRIATSKLVTGKKMVVVEPGGGKPLAAGALAKGEPPDPGAIAQAKAALKDTVDHARAQTTGLGRALLNPDEQPPRAAGGTVDLDRPGRYRVRLVSVRVHSTNAAGDDWDGPGAGEADVLVQVWVGARQVLLTEQAEDTEKVRYRGRKARSEAFDIGRDTRIRVKVLDIDVTGNDEIGIIELEPTPADAGRTFRLAAGRVAELEIALEKEEATR